MKKSWKILVLGALASSLAAGSAFFSFPGTTSAGVESCITGMLASKVSSETTVTSDETSGEAELTSAEASGAGESMQSVPTHDSAVEDMVKAASGDITDMIKADATINTDTASQTKGLSIQRCIVEPLVTTMAKSVLSKFTAQTVKWINSGFKGSPMYVTNPQGFMSDAADQALGSFISGLGPIGSILCSPFDLQLRLSLNAQFGISAGAGSGYEQYVGCRLSTIEQNVQRAFTGGSFGKGGWDNWIKLTATPQNNPYGAYLKAVNTLDAKVGGTQASLKTQLDWGKGFLSATDSTTGKITTPGSIIEDQLSTTLGEPVREVGLAKDLDAILNALTSQMINQVMGGVGGLFGASKTTSSGTSVVSQGLNSTASSVIAQNNASKNLPDGVLSASGFASTNLFCADFAQNRYSKNKNDPTDSRVWIEKFVTVNPTTGETIYTNPHLTEKTSAKIPWTIDDFNGIVLFCQNIGLTTPLSDVTDQINNQVGNVTGVTLTADPISINPGQSSTLKWTSSIKTGAANSAYSCTSDIPNFPPSSNDALQKNNSTGVTVTPTATITYHFNCTDSNNNVTSATAKVTVTANLILPTKIQLISAMLNQSTIYNNNEQTYGPLKAAAANGSNYYSASNSYVPGWWTAYLPTPDNVVTIRVHSYPGYGNYTTVVLGNIPQLQSGIRIAPSDVSAANSLVTFYINNYMSPPVTFTAGAGYTGTVTYTGTADDFTFTLSKPATINSIVVSRTSSIDIYGIEAYRPINNGTGGGGTGGGTGGGVNAISFIPSEQYSKPRDSKPLDASCQNDYSVSCKGFSASSSFSGNLSQNMITNVKFYRTVYDPASPTLTDQEIAFTAVFDANDFKINNMQINDPTEFGHDPANGAFFSNNAAPVSSGQAFNLTGTISDTAISNNTNYPSYKIVTELFNPLTGRVTATQTTTFKIQ